jgi:hypothetical protein
MSGATFHVRNLRDIGTKYLPEVAENVGAARRKVGGTIECVPRGFDGIFGGFMGMPSSFACQLLIGDVEEILGRTEAALREAGHAMVKVATRYSAVEDINIGLVTSALGDTGRVPHE